MRPRVGVLIRWKKGVATVTLKRGGNKLQITTSFPFITGDEVVVSTNDETGEYVLQLKTPRPRQLPVVPEFTYDVVEDSTDIDDTVEWDISTEC